MRRSAYREAILRIVCDAPEHPTLQDVYREARKRFPHIGLATVYRHLERLVQEGVLRKVILGDRMTRYDPNTGKHYHIRCIECGRVDDLPMSFMDDVNETIGRYTGYTIVDHFLEVAGICPACAWSAHGGKKSPQPAATSN